MRLSAFLGPSWGRFFAPLVFAGMLTASRAQGIDVLFVGNSYINGYVEPVLTFNRNQITDLNNQGNNRQGGVPGIFKALAAAGGYEVNVSLEALNGQTLETHLATKSALIGQSKWDWVVLQEYSSRPLPEPVTGEPLSGNIAAFRAAVEGLSLLVKQHNPGAGLLLHENWARPNLVVSANNPSAPYLTLAGQQADIQAAMGAAAADFGLVMAPVGAAFFAAIDAGIADNTRTPILEGPVNLWFGDAYHASAYGSYLSALVYYVEILGGDPRDLATGAGSVAAQLGLDAGHALALASIAYETASPPVVPEPSTLASLSGALLSLAAFRGRQRADSRT